MGSGDPARTLLHYLRARAFYEFSQCLNTPERVPMGCGARTELSFSTADIEF